MNNTKKRSRVGLWLAISLAIFFFISTTILTIPWVSLYMVQDSFHQSEQKNGDLTEVIFDGEGKDKIVIISVNGIITAQSIEGYFDARPSTVESINAQLDMASSDPLVKAVILEIDSPGGDVTASDIIHDAVLNFKAKTNKPVVVSMQGVAASGAYYIAVAADKIIAVPTTITGSIGVIMPLINIAKLAKEYGVKDVSITSGKMKNIGSPLEDMTQDQKDILLEIVNEMYTRFVKVIADGRNMNTDIVQKLADGRIYTGTQAMAKGLVDKLGYIEDAIIITKKLSALETATIIKYQKKFDFNDIFSIGLNALAKNRSINITAKGIKLGDDTPRFMYLWTGS